MRYQAGAPLLKEAVPSLRARCQILLAVCLQAGKDEAEYVFVYLVEFVLGRMDVVQSCVTPLFWEAICWYFRLRFHSPLLFYFSQHPFSYAHGLATSNSA